jgi:hypothetical protein
MSARRIAVKISEQELLAFLTSSRRLALPQGAEIKSAGFEVSNALDPDFTRDWFLYVEHASFAPVTFRVPVVEAATLEVQRKQVSSAPALVRRAAAG